MVTLQRTLNKSFTLEGEGLHTGLKVQITFHPASIDSGYQIRRIDLPGMPIVKAIAENVVSTDRGVTLGSAEMRISSVEHTLAALYGCEVDNCLIDIDGPEFPAMDGSSIMFVQKILETGFTNQNAKRVYISFPRKKIRVKDNISKASLILIPNNSFNIHSQISFDSVLLKQQEVSLTELSSFIKDVATARTFVFVREIESLLNKNLIKGGNIHNAIIIYDQVIAQYKLDELSDIFHVKRKNANHLGYLMSKPLNISDEPVRHKLLDLIGDLALVGYFIKGKIMAYNSGHTINNVFVREIRKNIKHRDINKS